MQMEMKKRAEVERKHSSLEKNGGVSDGKDQCAEQAY